MVHLLFFMGFPFQTVLKTDVYRANATRTYIVRRCFRHILCVPRLAAFEAAICYFKVPLSFLLSLHLYKKQ